jgi:hypothetical protein
VGWKGYAVTWINRKYPQISPTLHKYFCDNFELIFEKALCAIRTNLEEYAKSTDIQLVKNVCELLEVKLHINSLQKPDEADSKKHLLTILSFCIAWGMGASLSERSKDQVRMHSILFNAHFMHFMFGAWLFILYITNIEILTL